MRSACPCMMARNFVSRGGVVPGVTAQGLDEACQRGQGGAKLVAGVGQEIGARRFAPADLGLVVEGQQGEPRLPF